MNQIIYFGLTLSLFTSSGCLAQESKTTGSITKHFSFSTKPTWSDEFETDGKPAKEIWDFDLGSGGWGNNELQTYTNSLENAYVKDGVLIIKTIKGRSDTKYTSARLVTRNKKNFLYGRIEVKAKIPEGRGTWPAIWTLASENNYGNSYWPDNGELDIMEHVGYDQGRIHSNIHTKAFNHVRGTNKGGNRLVENVSKEFHRYRIDWYPHLIQFFIDDEKHFEFRKDDGFGFAEWPFDKPQYLLLNIAIGGNWGGQKGIDESIFPQQMEIDYVRFYQLETSKP